jgi:cytochrome P450
MMIFAFGPEHNRLIHSETDRFISRPFVLPGPKGSSQHQLRASLFRLNGPEHARMRHQMLPPFQKSAVAHYHGAVVGLVDQLTRSWAPGQLLDLQKEVLGLVWNIAAKLLYGLDESVASDKLHHAIEDWLADTFAPWVRGFPINLPGTPYRGMLRKAENLDRTFRAILRAKREEGGEKSDALAALMRARFDDRPLSDNALVGHALTLFLVAYETTANTLTWTLFLLAQHPDVQADLLDELAFLHSEPPTVEQLNRLPLLNRVFKESARILPAVPYSRRRDVLGGPMGPYHVPKKSRIVFSNYVTHHLPDLYPEPERFLPRRWETITPSPAEYLPFGAGIRTCIGASMAQFIVKTAVAMIVPSWRLTVAPNVRIDRHVGISLGPKHGIPVILARQDRQLERTAIRGNIHQMVDLHAPPLHVVRAHVKRLAA